MSRETVDQVSQTPPRQVRRTKGREVDTETEQVELEGLTMLTNQLGEADDSPGVIPASSPIRARR